jgi:hypothetical protein
MYVDAEREGGICTSADDKGAEAALDGGSLVTLVNGVAMTGDLDDGDCETMVRALSWSVLAAVLILVLRLGENWTTLRRRD